MICQHNDTTCHGSLCLGELFSCEILSLNVLSGSIFDLQVQHWSEGSQTQRRHTSSSCQRLHFKSCNNVHSLLMELVQPPPPPFMPRVSNWTITYSPPPPPPEFCCCCCRTSTTVNTPSYFILLYLYSYRHQNLLLFSFLFLRERMTLQQFNFKELWPELKCGRYKHHLKCQNNHQHNCGHSVSRKEEEQESTRWLRALKVKRKKKGGHRRCHGCCHYIKAKKDRWSTLEITWSWCSWRGGTSYRL